MANYRGELVDHDTKQVFVVTYDEDAQTWLVTVDDSERQAEAAMLTSHLGFLSRDYETWRGPFLAYCLWHVERLSLMTLRDGLPDPDPDDMGPDVVY